MGKHAKYSPSGYEGWSNCVGWQSDPKGSSYADWGTDAHELAATCLTTGCDTSAHIGAVLPLGNTVDQEMAQCVQEYIDLVRAQPGDRYVEWSVPLESMTKEAGAKGTADAVVINEGELSVFDLKTGVGVPVDAVGNGQLRMYAAGALEILTGIEEVETVRLVIVQPRRKHTSEEVLSAEQLRNWAKAVRPATELVPGDAQCMWCKAKATCPALVGQLVATVPASPALFDDESRPSVLTSPTDLTPEVLALIYPKLGMLKDWIDACHDHVHTLVAMGEFPGYKMIEGRKGNRAWTDAKQAEAVLKQMKLKIEEMYELKLISPTKAEKLAESGAIGPRQWPKLQQHINRPNGKPTVVPLSDLRPALVFKAPADAFNFEEQ